MLNPTTTKYNVKNEACLYSSPKNACSLGLTRGLPQFQNFQAAGAGAGDQGRGRAPVQQQQQIRSSPSQRGGLPPSQDEPRGREEQRETTTPVPILKQINEHNEDGSYTYGYEAADGTFKLETRFQDGSVQGKYGYVDVNGEVKIIEYGANAMGFQPQGDLPDGIIIPPPVAGNCTECDYDYDYVEEVRSGNIVSEDQSNLVVQNRARGNSPQPQPPVQLANQFRGQQLDQPITPAPLPRQPAFQQQQQQQQQQSFPTFTARQPAPAPAAQAPAPIRQAPSVPARRPAPAAVQSRQPIGAPRQAVPSRQAAPAPQRAAPPTPASPEFLPTRPTPALPPTIAPVRRLPDPVPASPSSSGSSSAFSNFPARDSPSSRSRPIRPSGDQSARFQARPAAPEDSETDFDAPAPERQNPARGRQRGSVSRAPVATPSRNAIPTRSQPQAAFPPQQPQAAFPPQQAQPAFQQQSQQAAFQPQQQQAAFPPQQQVFQPQQQAFQQQPQQSAFQSGPIRPAFEDVSTGGASQSFSSFPAVAASRPALTFQEPLQPVSAVPNNLPKSALEIVDFNQLVQEFQGSLRPQPAGARFQNNVFSSPPNTQTRFSTDNFPVRF